MIKKHKPAVSAADIEDIYNNLPGAVFSCRFDEEWTIISANDRLYSFLGYTRKEFEALGNKMSAVIHPDDHAVMKKCIVDQLAAGKNPIENENRLVCKDGSIKWISIRAKLYKDDDDEDFFYCIFVDITKQKTEELRIREVEKNLAIAMDHGEMLYWEYDIKASSVSVNNTTQEWFKVPSVIKDYPESYLKLGFVAEESIPVYRDAVEKIKQGMLYVEFVARIKTIQRDFEWMRIRFTNVKDNAGKPIRAICTGEIISEYKDLENRFRMTLRQNNVESWVYDIKRHTIIVDEKTFFAANYRVGDEIQNVPESWIERKLCYPEDAEILRRLYRRLENGEKQVVESLRLLDSTVNKYRWKKCIYTVIEDSKGQGNMAIGSSIDITDQMEAERKYEDSVEYRKRTQTENLLISGHCSILENRILEMTDCTNSQLLQKFGSVRSEFFSGIEKMILDEEKRKEFHDRFSNEGIIRNLEKGIHENELICEISFEPDRKKRYWVIFHIDVIRIPDNGNVEGFITMTDITNIYIKEQVLNTVIKTDYD